MPFVEWKPEFSVGIERFDDDHRHLFLLLNQLHVSMAGRKISSALNIILKELDWYAQTHFRAEEVLMKRYRYPELAAHRAEHDRFTEQVAQFSRHFQSGRDEIIVEVSDTLWDWLAQHILQSDAAYARFFQSIGVANIRTLQQLNEDCSELASR
jgi:hemerythrin